MKHYGDAYFQGRQLETKKEISQFLAILYFF